MKTLLRIDFQTYLEIDDPSKLKLLKGNGYGSAEVFHPSPECEVPLRVVEDCRFLDQPPPVQLRLPLDEF